MARDIEASAIESGVYTDLRSLTATRRAAQDLQIFQRRVSKGLLLGNVRSRLRGRGMEFEEARPYQAGDDIRSIDWRVSARTGMTHTKVFAEERERPVHIVLDQRNAMFFGSAARFKSTLAAELAACLAWAALGASDRIGGQVFSDQDEAAIRARRSKHAILQLLTRIVLFNHSLPGRAPDTPRRRDSMLEECRRLTRPGTTIFVLSDFADFDDAAAKNLARLGRHTEITLFWISDPLESTLGLSGRLGLSDGRTTRSVDFSNDLRERYQAQRQRHQVRLEEAARRSRARLVPVSTSEAPISFLRRLYRG